MSTFLSKVFGGTNRRRDGRKSNNNDENEGDEGDEGGDESNHSSSQQACSRSRSTSQSRGRPSVSTLEQSLLLGGAFETVNQSAILNFPSVENEGNIGDSLPNKQQQQPQRGRRRDRSVFDVFVERARSPLGAVRRFPFRSRVASPSSVQNPQTDRAPHLSLRFPSLKLAPDSIAHALSLGLPLDDESAAVLLSAGPSGRPAVSTFLPPYYNDGSTYRRNHRLVTPSEAFPLVRVCSRAIINRGLDTLGIMHPNWHAASYEVQQRLVELYFRSLTSTPPLSTKIDKTHVPEATVFRHAFDTEIASPRTDPHDISAVLCWALIHLRLDINSDPQELPKWYASFVAAESAASFPARAYSTLLVPSLRNDDYEYAQLLDAMLELFGYLAAHAERNGCAGRGGRVARRFSGWLFGIWLRKKFEDKNQPLGSEKGIQGKEKNGDSERLRLNWRVFYNNWEKTANVMEHLFLARIRDEAASTSASIPTTFHRVTMPVRLLELVEDYPQAYSHLIPTDPHTVPSGSQCKLRGSRTPAALLVRIGTKDADEYQVENGRDRLQQQHFTGHPLLTLLFDALFEDSSPSSEISGVADLDAAGPEGTEGGSDPGLWQVWERIRADARAGLTVEAGVEISTSYLMQTQTQRVGSGLGIGLGKVFAEETLGLVEFLSLSQSSPVRCETDDFSFPALKEIKEGHRLSSPEHIFREEGKRREEKGGELGMLVGNARRGPGQLDEWAEFIATGFGFSSLPSADSGTTTSPFSPFSILSTSTLATTYLSPVGGGPSFSISPPDGKLKAKEKEIIRSRSRRSHSVSLSATESESRSRTLWPRSSMARRSTSQRRSMESEVVAVVAPMPRMSMSASEDAFSLDNSGYGGGKGNSKRRRVGGDRNEEDFKERGQTRGRQPASCAHVLEVTATTLDEAFADFWTDAVVGGERWKDSEEKNEYECERERRKRGGGGEGSTLSHQVPSTTQKHLRGKKATWSWTKKEGWPEFIVCKLRQGYRYRYRNREQGQGDDEECVFEWVVVERVPVPEIMRRQPTQRTTRKPGPGADATTGTVYDTSSSGEEKKEKRSSRRARFRLRSRTRSPSLSLRVSRQPSTSSISMSASAVTSATGSPLSSLSHSLGTSFRRFSLFSAASVADGPMEALPSEGVRGGVKVGEERRKEEEEDKVLTTVRLRAPTFPTWRKSKQREDIREGMREVNERKPVEPRLIAPAGVGLDVTTSPAAATHSDVPRLPKDTVIALTTVDGERENNAARETETALGQCEAEMELELPPRPDTAMGGAFAVSGVGVIVPSNVSPIEEEEEPEMEAIEEQEGEKQELEIRVEETKEDIDRSVSVVAMENAATDRGAEYESGLEGDLALRTHSGCAASARLQVEVEEASATSPLEEKFTVQENIAVKVVNKDQPEKGKLSAPEQAVVSPEISPVPELLVVRDEIVVDNIGEEVEAEGKDEERFRFFVPETVTSIPVQAESVNEARGEVLGVEDDYLHPESGQSLGPSLRADPGEEEDLTDAQVDGSEAEDLKVVEEEGPVQEVSSEGAKEGGSAEVVEDAIPPSEEDITEAVQADEEAEIETAEGVEETALEPVASGPNKPGIIDSEIAAAHPFETTIEPSSEADAATELEEVAGGQFDDGEPTEEMRGMPDDHGIADAEKPTAHIVEDAVEAGKQMDAVLEHEVTAEASTGELSDDGRAAELEAKSKEASIKHEYCDVDQTEPLAGVQEPTVVVLQDEPAAEDDEIVALASTSACKSGDALRVADDDDKGIVLKEFSAADDQEEVESEPLRIEQESFPIFNSDHSGTLSFELKSDLEDTTVESDHVDIVQTESVTVALERAGVIPQDTPTIDDDPVMLTTESGEIVYGAGKVDSGVEEVADVYKQVEAGAANEPAAIPEEETVATDTDFEPDGVDSGTQQAEPE